MAVDLKPSYDHIYFAPHLDDVALSCGGQIYDHTVAGESVLIVTVTAADPPSQPLTPYMQSLHDRWSAAAGQSEESPADDMVALRRREDQRATELLGAEALHWPFQDCIYRYHPTTGTALYDSNEALFGDVDMADLPQFAQIAARMTELPPADQAYLPLGVGNHVDHQLVRAAGEQAFGRAVAYYEDYPYAREAGAVDTVLAASDYLWEPALILLTEAAVAAKTAAILTYESQVSSFFAGEADLTRQLQAYGQRLIAEGGDMDVGPQVAGVERLWRRSA